MNDHIRIGGLRFRVTPTNDAPAQGGSVTNEDLDVNRPVRRPSSRPTSATSVPMGNAAPSAPGIRFRRPTPLPPVTPKPTTAKPLAGKSTPQNVSAGQAPQRPAGTSSERPLLRLVHGGNSQGGGARPSSPGTAKGKPWSYLICAFTDGGTSHTTTLHTVAPVLTDADRRDAQDMLSRHLGVSIVGIRLSPLTQADERGRAVPAVSPYVARAAAGTDKPWVYDISYCVINGSTNDLFRRATSRLARSRPLEESEILPLQSSLTRDVQAKWGTQKAAVLQSFNLICAPGSSR